jgi:hypothetical protein
VFCLPNAQKPPPTTLHHFRLRLMEAWRTRRTTRTMNTQVPVLVVLSLPVAVAFLASLSLNINIYDPRRFTWFGFKRAGLKCISYTRTIASASKNIFSWLKIPGGSRPRPSVGLTLPISRPLTIAFPRISMTRGPIDLRNSHLLSFQIQATEITMGP